MKNLKPYFFFILLFFTQQAFCQEINIFIHNSSNKVDSAYVNLTYSSIGFSQVNIVESNINTTLDTSAYDLAFVVEGAYYDFNSQGWVLEPILETERQILQNFVEQGGHLVWITENGESGQTSESAFTTVNNIYETIISNGTYFNNAGYGSPLMHRIHPSNGPAGLSPTQTIYSSGSYATMVDVPNCNKLYTSESMDYSYDTFDECTHTTLAVFPVRPKPNNGSIIVSTELGTPMKPWIIWGGSTPTTIYNTELDNAIASLHYKLLVEENTDTINDWSDIESNMNADCPTASASYTFGETELCVGDTIVFLHADGQSVFYTNQDTGTYRLSVYYEQGTCRDDTIVYVNFTDAYVDAGIDRNICEGEEVTLVAENPSNATISWDNNVTDSVPFIPTSTQTYYVTSNKYNCSNEDSVTITINEVPTITINIENDTSICFGESITLTATNSLDVSTTWSDSIQNNVPFIPSESSNYTVTADNNGCIDTDSITIEVNPSPTLVINGDMAVCEGEVILLNAESNSSVIWNDSIQNNRYQTVTDNSYFIAHAAINNCKAKDSFYVEVYPKPEPNFNVNYLGYYEDSQNIFFENMTIDNDITFRWILGYGIESSDYSVEQSYTVERDTILKIVLVAENSNNCIDSIYKNVRLDKNRDEIIHVPSAFTPDDDFLNDGVKPIFNFTPEDYHFLVFNRWGELIFETNDVEMYWDGKLKGSKVPDGLYTYRVRYNRKIKVGTFNVFK